MEEYGGILSTGLHECSLNALKSLSIIQDKAAYFNGTSTTIKKKLDHPLPSTMDAAT